MPVDRVKRAVLELALLSPVDQRDVVCHVQNTKLFHWTHDLLPALRKAGMEFETVTQRKWVELLRKSESDPSKNPTIKLVDFFADKYDNDRPGREGLVFETEETGLKSNAVKEGFDVIESGLVEKMVDSWNSQW